MINEQKNKCRAKHGTYFFVHLMVALRAAIDLC